MKESLTMALSSISLLCFVYALVRVIDTEQRRGAHRRRLIYYPRARVSLTNAGYLITDWVWNFVSISKVTLIPSSLLSCRSEIEAESSKRPQSGPHWSSCVGLQNAASRREVLGHRCYWPAWCLHLDDWVPMQWRCWDPPFKAVGRTVARVVA